MKKWRRHVAGAPDGVIRSILAAAFLLPIAACTAGPDFNAPLAPLAQNFRGADNRSVKSGPREYERWWEGFRDPTLNRLTQIAYNQNLTLLSAGTRVLQARAVLGIAIGIAYPQVQQGVGSILNNKSSAATPLSPKRDTFVFLDGCPCRASGLGAGLLGKIPPRCGIGRCSLSSIDRILRWRAGI